MPDAGEHELLQHYHQVDKEKRMVVVLPTGAYDDWLDAPVERTTEFMLPYPAERLVATPMPSKKESAD